MSTLERAIEIAAEAHSGQRDKAGAPYISHPLRVALAFIRANDEKRAIIAVLHDVVEDSAWTLTDLTNEGFSEEIVDAVKALSRPDDEPYEAFVRRAGANALAKPVKLADLRDNIARTRLAKLQPEECKARLDKYEGALALLS